MNLDDRICYCFHITRRKLVNYIRIHQPRVPSQLSECGGAGTGCGWCIPFIKQIFKQQDDGSLVELDRMTAGDYEKMRATYIRSGGGTPPPGAAPLPPDDQ
jgi:NAD(P)H-nitrite reductase large subunit